MRLDEELQGIGSVGIAGHIRPDGDCVGSCLSVYNYITTYFPQNRCRRYFGADSDNFSFLAGGS